MYKRNFPQLQVMIVDKLSKISIRRVSAADCNITRTCWPKPAYGPVDVQRTILLNGMKVAVAKPLGGQIGACTIMYQAGSRYEVDEFLGANHFLRAASCASSCAFSGFMKMRFMSQYGASITCSSDRQSIAYTLRCPVTTFSEMKCFLLDTVIRCCFKEWEMEDLKPMIRDDLHRIHPEKRVLDLAQKACWGGPLNNSIYCEPSRINGITGEILDNYADWNYKSDHCSVASIKPNPRCIEPSFPRRGFELYDLGANSDTWICVVVPGCGTKDLTSLLKHSIVAHACGTGNMQDGSHVLDRTPELPLGLMAGNDVYTSFRAFNLSYYETGVFGIVARTRAPTAWNVTKAAAEFLSNVGCLSYKQIEIGKKRLKVSLAIHDDDCVRVAEGLALQLASGNRMDTALESMALIDGISNEDVSSTAIDLSKK
uniref:SFRICE_007345 n=1 Tax=Spodoptera frugiperda TaxID=7108 RepID=A0A2H1V369_SPOFR